MSTIRDVAKRASVSTGTASQALSGRGRVSDETRLRVLDAAEELGYTTGPGSKRSRPQLVLYMRVGEGVDPFAGFFYRIISSVMAEASALGYDLIVRPMPESQTLPVHAPTLLGRGMAGAIIHTHNPMPVTGPVEVRDPCPPVVLLGQDTPGTTCVSIDNAGAMGLVVHRLYGLGHRSIAYVGPSSPCLDGILREQGYTGAMRGLGLAPVRMCTDTLVKGGIGDCTAYACFDDHTAVAVLKALADASIDVPGDRSVIGFGRLPEPARAYPGLATVAHPVEEHSRMAVRLVHDSINGACTTETHVTLACRVVDGGTIAEPPVIEGGSENGAHDR